TTGFVIACTLAGCGHLNSAIVPVVPTRQYTSPTFTPANNEFGATIPAGRQPTNMKFSGLTEKETKDSQIIVPVGKIKQLYVDIQLDNNQVLKNYYAVKWSVSNSEVGSINNRGIFTPLKEGTTRAIASIGGVSSVIELSVSSAPNIWAQVIAPTTRDLYAVKMVNDSEAWAVGQGGTILHYLNGNWNDESAVAAAGGADLTGIDVTESGDAWAVGGSTIIHYNGGKWEAFPSTAGGTLKSIDMINANDGWAVGTKADGGALIMRYTGGTWQPVESGIDESLNSVQALGPSEVWVGGKSRFLGEPALYKYDGNKWKKAKFNNDTIISNIISKVKPWDGTYEIKSVKMLNSSQGWIVGEYSPVLSTLRGKRGFMFRYDSVKDTWERGTFDGSTPNLDQVPLKNIGMISGGKGWVLGTNTPAKTLLSKAVNDIPGAFLSCDGKQLKVETQYQANTVGKSFYGIDILPNGNGIVVGENGFIMQHQYDLSRPNYSNNSGNFSNYSNYGSQSSSGSYNDGSSNY
ncbi:MAG: hypothetical protein H7263_09730, partial [Candidatus Sericytochromatia bacterium]|nr:hypothetical protein [Candidatus Sericytochromatia bacterium]